MTATATVTLSAERYGELLRHEAENQLRQEWLNRKDMSNETPPPVTQEQVLQRMIENAGYPLTSSLAMKNPS